MMLLRILVSLLVGTVSADPWYGFNTIRPLIAPIGTPFGFLAGGEFVLQVKDFKLTDVAKKGTDERIKKVEAGFFLRRFANEAEFTSFVDEVSSNRTCVFEFDIDDELGFSGSSESRGSIESAKDGILLSMRSDTREISYKFKEGEEGLYVLMYQVCPFTPMIKSTFKIEFHRYNYDQFGSRSYLSAGEMILPMMFVFFSVSYVLCLFLWSTNLRQIQQGGTGIFLQNTNGARPTVHAIHHFMTVLLLLKFLCMFTESIRYHFIRVYGHAEAWTFIYYAISFFKGTFLFTVILLIGSGWSFVKPFLSTREKYVMLAVLILQVLSNLALAVLSQEISGEKGYDRWTAVLHLVDIICCCIVLVPIVWQVNALEKGIGEEDDDDEEIATNEPETGEKGEILEKLKMFRSFYLVVVAYIYATRILIYLFTSVLDYQHIWIQHFVIEMVTLCFYVVVGFMFHPKQENAYRKVGVEDANGAETELPVVTNRRKD